MYGNACIIFVVGIEDSPQDTNIFHEYSFF